MLLETVEATNVKGDTLTLQMTNPDNGIVIEDIQGLGPVKATLVSAAFANMDGEQFYSSRREKRNMIFTLGLTPDYAAYSAHALRDELYKFFMPKTTVSLKFMQQDLRVQDPVLRDRVLVIEGTVESLEPVLFSADPQVAMSILAFDPDFCKPDKVTFDGFTTSDLSETLLEYDGTVETGCLFVLESTRLVDDLSIFHRTPDNKLRTFQIDHDIDDTDVLMINSVRGDKYVRLAEGGVERSILYSTTTQSVWIELFPGDNHFRVYSAGIPVPYRIEYIRKFGGL